MSTAVKTALIEMGGTINGILDPDDPPPTSSRVRAWLERERPDLDLLFKVIAMKDSRAVDDQDRSALRTAIECCNERCVLVPHGTFTMTTTGEYLMNHLNQESLSKVIVLVGARLPLGEAGSDAPANLQLAIEALQHRQTGVWVVMSGKVWRPDEVIKDTQSGEFVPRS